MMIPQGSAAFPFIFGSAAASPAAAENTAAGAAARFSADSGAKVLSFAAFIAAMFGTLEKQAAHSAGMRTWPAEWFAGQIPALQPEATTDEEFAESTAALLEQLAAWLTAVTPEQRGAMLAMPEVQQWAAMAEAELIMAGYEEAKTAENANGMLRTEHGGSADKEPLTGLILRLAEAIAAKPEQPALAAAGRQGFAILAEAAARAEAIPAEAWRAPEQAMGQNGKQAEFSNIRQVQDALHIQRLLGKLSGTVQSSSADAAGENIAALPRMSHLTVLEAKTPLVHYTNLRGAPAESAELTPGAKPAGITRAEPALEQMDAAHTARSAGNIRAESMPEPVRVPLSHLTDRAGEWMARMASGGGAGRAETVLKLVPEHLGEVEVKLAFRNGQLSAVITAETAAAKEALESNLAALRTNLQQQGLTVERLVVSHTSSQVHSGTFHDGKQQQQSQRQGESRAAKRDDAEDWLEQLVQGAELDAEAYAAIGAGGVFRAEA